MPSSPPCISVVSAGIAPAVQVYQYAVPARDVAGKEITAFLWVPSEAKRIRGVLIGGSTLMEPEFAGDPVIRKACAVEQLAIVYFSPSLDAVFDYKEKKSAALLQQALDALAEASGYREIAVAPLFPFGHSVGTIFASHVVCWNPEALFRALLFKGGIRIPPTILTPPLWVYPFWAIKGQFEEFGPAPSGVLRDFEDRETAWKGLARPASRIARQGRASPAQLPCGPRARRISPGRSDSPPHRPVHPQSGTGTDPGLAG